MEYKKHCPMFDPILEDVRWTEPPTKIGALIINELKTMGVVVRARYFVQLVEEIAAGYDQLPYHNFRHAAHVTFMTLWYLRHLKRLTTSTEFAWFALNMVFVSLCHDLGHRGAINTRFRTSHSDNLSSIDYETQSIMSSTSDNENMHSYRTTKLLKKYGNKISHSYDLNTNGYFFHNCIMATDLRLHDKIVTDILPIIKTNSLESILQSHPVILGMMFIKCADLGHFCCHSAVHIHWVCKLEEELLKCGSSRESEDDCESSIRGELNSKKTYIKRLSEATLGFYTRYVKRLQCELCNLLKMNSEMLTRNTNLWMSMDRLKPDKIPKTYIDRMSIEAFEKDPTKRRSIETHEEVCICMIDIVNFTQWSSDKSPENIFETMSLYNEFIVELIESRTDVEKIEMVGDSMMIIGGLRNGCDMNTKLAMFQFVSTLLNDIDRLKRLFADNMISLRIGMHIGNIHIGCVQKPMRMQVFGNSICVASRMESNTFPGTLMVSETLFDAIETWHDQIEYVSPGKIVSTSMKGVGIVKCMCVFTRKHKLNILIGDDLRLSTRMIGAKVKQLVPDANIKRVHDLVEFKEELYRCPYDFVIADWSFQHGETVEHLIYEYRIFEERWRSGSTRIVVFSTSFEDSYRPDVLGSLIASVDVVSRTRVCRHLEEILKPTLT